METKLDRQTKLGLDITQFNPRTSGAQVNREKKLMGSYGMTTVVPMPELQQAATNSMINQLIRSMNLTSVQPQKMNSENHFFDAKQQVKDNEPLIIAPISHLHTTMASWQVMDATNRNQWDNELIRSRLCAYMARNGFDVFSNNSPYRKLLYEVNMNCSFQEYKKNLQNKMNEMIDDNDFGNSLNDRKVENIVEACCRDYSHSYDKAIDKGNIKPFTLQAASIKLNNDGNIVIQWQSSPELQNFRQELCKQGGIAKWGANVATTVAYFPNWDTMKPEDREEVAEKLQKIIAETDLSWLNTMTVNPEELQLVTFARNDLSEHSAKWEEAIAVFAKDNDINPESLKVSSYDNVCSKFEPKSEQQLSHSFQQSSNM